MAFIWSSFYSLISRKRLRETLSHITHERYFSNMKSYSAMLFWWIDGIEPRYLNSLVLSRSVMSDSTKRWDDSRLNSNKSELLITDFNKTGTANISDVDLLRTKGFNKINSMPSANCQLSGETDRRTNECHKFKIYRNVVRPFSFYGSECWSTIIGNKRSFAVMEINIMHWTGNGAHGRDGCYGAVK